MVGSITDAAAHPSEFYPRRLRHAGIDQKRSPLRPRGHPAIARSLVLSMATHRFDATSSQLEFHNLRILDHQSIHLKRLDGNSQRPRSVLCISEDECGVRIGGIPENGRMRPTPRRPVCNLLSRPRGSGPTSYQAARQLRDLFDIYSARYSLTVRAFGCHGGDVCELLPGHMPFQSGTIMPRGRDFRVRTYL